MEPRGRGRRSRVVSVGTFALFGATFAACTLTTSLSDLSGSGSPEAGTDAPLAPTDASEAGQASTGDADAAPCTLKDGLVGRYTMDAVDVKGTRLVDSSGNGNDGVLYGSPAPAVAPGRIGDALQYPAGDAGNPHVDVPGLPLDTSATGITTVSFWFFRNGATMDAEILVDVPAANPRFDLILMGQGQPAHLLCFNTATAGDCWGVDSATLHDRWVHVAALFHNGVLSNSELYVDGLKVTASCLSAPNQACDQERVVGLPLSLGGSGSYFFHGLVDDVRVYSRALTAAEIAALHADKACE